MLTLCQAKASHAACITSFNPHDCLVTLILLIRQLRCQLDQAHQVISSRGKVQSPPYIPTSDVS